MIEIRAMGDLRISHEGTELALPASRKTRALCGYLALVDQKHSRQSLCELLWEIPDDPRGALRWSLSKLRGILNRSEQVLLTYGDWVELERKGLQVDVVDLQRARTGRTPRTDASGSSRSRGW